MKISGDKTASVFRRYDITDEADLAGSSRTLRRKAECSNTRVRADFGHSCTKYGQFSKSHFCTSRQLVLYSMG